MWFDEWVECVLRGSKKRGSTHVTGGGQGVRSLLFKMLMAFSALVKRKQNDECLSELGIEPSLGKALSNYHYYVNVGAKDDANT